MINIYHGRAKLNDLEFAKEYGTRTSSNVRTVSRLRRILVFLLIFCLGYLQFQGGRTSKHIFEPEQEFSHSLLLDLESFWWLLV